MAELVVVIVEGPGAGREFALAGSVVAGRDPSAPIPLDDPEASRQHASITAREGGAVVEDLGSTNGTFVGEERITGPRDIAPGERFRIGTTVIELRGAAVGAGAPPQPPPSTPPPEAAAPPPAPEEPAAAMHAPARGPPPRRRRPRPRRGPRRRPPPQGSGPPPCPRRPPGRRRRTSRRATTRSRSRPNTRSTSRTGVRSSSGGCC